MSAVVMRWFDGGLQFCNVPVRFLDHSRGPWKMVKYASFVTMQSHHHHHGERWQVGPQSDYADGESSSSKRTTSAIYPVTREVWFAQQDLFKQFHRCSVNLLNNPPEFSLMWCVNLNAWICENHYYLNYGNHYVLIAKTLFLFTTWHVQQHGQVDKEFIFLAKSSS